MKAVVFDRYGPPDVLRVEEIERPKPKEDEVLVKVRATTVNRTDCGFRAAEPFFSRFFTGLLRPKYRTPGMELAGEVVAVGGAVSQFAVGDEVFGLRGNSANAEYVCVRESGALAHKPAALSFDEAAAVSDGACIALACLQNADPLDGKRIVVYGASGSIGTAAVQVAKALGAHVTAVCVTKSVELIRSLGADEIVDYTQKDFTKNGETYDVVLDRRQVLLRSVAALARPWRLYVATDRPYNFPLALLTKWVGERKVVFSASGYKRESVLLLKELLEAGKYRPVVDRTYPLEEVVEATRYVESWQKAGNVVLAMDAAS